MVHRVLSWLLVWWWLAPGPALAQHRPLLTQDPEVVGAGRLVVEVGAEFTPAVTYPASGLVGDLVRAPVVSATAGLGTIVELQLHAVVRERLGIDRRFEAPLSGELEIDGDVTDGVGPVLVATKVRVLRETPGRPSIGVRFATRLPTTSDEDGLGLDTLDFSAGLLLGKTLRAVRVAVNLGVGILGDATDGARQNDVLEYGVSATRPVAAAWALVAEANGRVSVRRNNVPPGTET
ncbi:MAG: hypothetical protein MUF60_08505, partial [Vicinamibacterales bacterium]|nr:hypothetical protein [Vicinamibacterales bacterium]